MVLFFLLLIICGGYVGTGIVAQMAIAKATLGDDWKSKYVMDWNVILTWPKLIT